MEQIIIKKINNGDTGKVAADKIYSNDENLKKAIRSIAETLESYGELVGITATVGDDQGQQIIISLVQNEGDDNTSVMSQKAVTDFVNDEVSGICKIGQEIETITNVPDPSDSANIWVSRASFNAEGNSLTVMYNDIQDLKNKDNQITELINEINSNIEGLNERITQIETILNIPTNNDE